MEDEIKFYKTSYPLGSILVVKISLKKGFHSAAVNEWLLNEPSDLKNLKNKY